MSEFSLFFLQNSIICQINKRKKFVLTENLLGVETPVPTRILNFYRNERFRILLKKLLRCKIRRALPGKSCVLNVIVLKITKIGKTCSLFKQSVKTDKILPKTAAKHCEKLRDVKKYFKNFSKTVNCNEM